MYVTILVGKEFQLAQHFMILKKLKSVTILQRLAQYIAEIVIIFIGITMSFVFDQWREDIKKKKELVVLSKSLLNDVNGLKKRLREDLVGSTEWINNLDSLCMQRASINLEERQLHWFYRMVTGQIIFLFDSYSPTYIAAVNNGTINDLPDSLKLQLYEVYRVKLPFFQLLYNEQHTLIQSFRNTTMITDETDLFISGSSKKHPDWALLRRQIQRPIYGNFIAQVVTTEREVYKLNESIYLSLMQLEHSLNHYINTASG
jgi:hypothetical protein